MSLKEDPTIKSLSLKILMVLVLVAFSVEWTGCGKEDKPTNPPDTLNHSPVIDSLTAEPDTFVMENSSLITVFAKDPDSDALSYEWNLAEELQAVAATSNTIRVMNCCPINEITAAVVLSIVKDGRGGEARDSITVWLLPLQ